MSHRRLLPTPASPTIPITCGWPATPRSRARSSTRRSASRAAQLRRVGGQLRLEVKRRVAGALGVVLVRDRGAEEGHDAVAGELVDRALEPMNALAEDGKEALHDLSPLLGVASLGELHRSHH